LSLNHSWMDFKTPDWRLLARHVGLARGIEEHGNFLGTLSLSGASCPGIKRTNPKISSRVTERGSMISNPLHLMYPALDENLAKKFSNTSRHGSEL
jgi:hypothetical protein